RRYQRPISEILSTDVRQPLEDAMHNGKVIIARLWPGYGGAVPSDADVVAGVSTEKYQTIIIHLTKNSSNPNTYEQKGKKVFYLTQKPDLPFFKPFVFLKLAALLKREKVDILHCHKHKTVFYGTIAGKLAGVPIILAHVHGMGRTRNFKRKILNRFIFSFVDRILTVSRAVREDVIQNNPSFKSENVINVGNSIDLDSFSSAIYDKQNARRKFGLSQDSFVFATAGRLVPTKGQKYLVEAFARIKKQITNAELIIAGIGELKDELEIQASDLGCRDSVHFPGFVENMRELYSCTDTFVLPSLAEGLPRTLIEAMASGVFCIAANAGGIPEILDNGNCGTLVPPKDSNALADAMLKAANMSQQTKSATISAAKKYIRECYSHDVMIKKIENIYDTLVAEKIR
ncbi:MAG: glycosyltransferase, partial [Sedimentisphaerales bacterium]